MKFKRIKIPMYDYTLIFAEIEGKQDADSKLLDKAMKELYLENEYKEELRDAIKRRAKNGGVTYRNMEYKKLLVVIDETTGDSIRRNIIAHELRHVVDRIMEHTQVNDMEAAAYLTGYLAEKIY